MAELLGRKPLFPGKDYVQQLDLITKVGPCFLDVSNHARVCIYSGSFGVPAAENMLQYLLWCAIAVQRPHYGCVCMWCR